MIRQALLSLSRQKKIQEISANAPISRSVVSRFVAGETEDDAVHAAGELAGEGLLSTIDHLGEDTLDRAQADFTIDVVTGTNRRLRKQLLAARHKFRHPIRIRGYVKDAMAIMRRASLLIGKPGGLTSAEAMASGTPLLIIRPLPGQERGNTEMLVRHGAAIHLDRDRDLPAVVTSLLTRTDLLDMLAERARALGKPGAARDIAAAVLDRLPAEELEGSAP